MRFPLPCLAWFALLAIGHAQPAPGTTPASPLSSLSPSTPAPVAVKAAAKPQHNEWVFSLLPKAFQKNPDLDLTVITEMTEKGKSLPPVSPQSPAYYVVQSGGYHPVGDAAAETPMPVTEIEGALQHALSANGYLPTSPEHPPSLLIIYLWGPDNIIDADNDAVSGDQVARNILDRAALAGGEKFAAELAKAMEQSALMQDAGSSHLGSQGDGSLGAAASMAQMAAIMDPVRLFKQQTIKNTYLVDQATVSCYYVVASAYDYRAFAAKQKVLLWRTRMTVNAQGVSQHQSLPTLIASAAPYFGVDMPEAEVLTKRAVREGKVEIGTPTVVVSSPTDTSAKKP